MKLEHNLINHQRVKTKFLPEGYHSIKWKSDGQTTIFYMTIEEHFLNTGLNQLCGFVMSAALCVNVKPYELLSTGNPLKIVFEKNIVILSVNFSVLKLPLPFSELFPVKAVTMKFLKIL